MVVHDDGRARFWKSIFLERRIFERKGEKLDVMKEISRVSPTRILISLRNKISFTCARHGSVWTSWSSPSSRNQGFQLWSRCVHSCSTLKDDSKNVSVADNRDTPSMKSSVIFVLGGPGTGKGTQSALLATNFKMMHISVGDLLRQEQATGSATGRLIESYLKVGQIVPVKVSLELLKLKFTQLHNSSDRFIVDGFPRNADNLRGWQEHGMDDVCRVKGCLWYDCSDSILLQRLLLRGQTSGRRDDNLESAKKRLESHREMASPVVEYYRKRVSDVCLHRFDTNDIASLKSAHST